MLNLTLDQSQEPLQLLSG